MDKKMKLQRKQNRRLLALLKAHEELGRDFDELDSLPEGFKESFEDQPAFRGWMNYHVTWDISPDDAWTAVLLKKPLVREWDEELAKRVPIITPAGEVVTLDQFEQMGKSGAKTLAELKIKSETKKSKRGSKKKEKDGSEGDIRPAD